MARSTWKLRERQAAAIFDGQRAPANTGGRWDFLTDSYVGQVKARQRLSLSEVTALCLEMERLGSQMSPPRLGVVLLKHSAGRGRPTPFIICCTEGIWRELSGRLPHETETC